MHQGPAVRARHMKSLLASVERLPPEESAAVRAHVPDALVHSVADATSIDWLPLELDLVLTRAVHRGVGEARSHAFFRDHLVEAFSGPLLSVVVDAALRVFRADATSFVSWVGRGWGLVFHECGTWRVERAGEGMARLRVEGLPGACLGDEIWLRSVSHSLDAFWVLARTQGACTYAERDVGGAAATYELRWR